MSLEKILTSFECSEDDLEDLNRELPIANYALDRGDVLLFLRKIFNQLHGNIKGIHLLNESLHSKRSLLEQRLLNHPQSDDIKNKLEEMLRINQMMLTHTLELQQQLTNTEKFTEWYWMQMTLFCNSLEEVVEEDLRAEVKLEATKEIKKYTLHEEEAQKARCYPFTSPLHQKPYPRPPYL